ncbi:alpha-E domain-containing protein [Uliginosibacterium sp. H3]|uniref:Alpha-E domain-containing protein n=1 Tax=Uliginosibacterium silvisoli TaxID=3114758 RepID=A0ABU6K513_9RHOO|nr:alpha-E domain-containing protein [Uliginosibacterium sp. H3]
MLSRTADHLFWMARYMERAENVARMLDVNYRMSLLPQSASDVERQWRTALDTMGQLESYQKLGGAFQALDVMRYMVLDRSNPSSIYSCLRAARENAHAVRGTLTSELWETTNATWIAMRSFNQVGLEGDGASEFFEWVKFRSHLSRGVTVGTMLRDDSLHFTRMGTFLERADSTARLLDVKFHELSTSGKHDDAAEYYEWSAMLRSVSGFEIFRRVYRDVITPKRVVELLMLRRDMPRSLACCMEEVYKLLQQVANQRSAETERRAGELAASLRFGRIDDIFGEGLHEYLTEFIGRVADLGNQISNDFLVPVVEVSQSQTQTATTA